MDLWIRSQDKEHLMKTTDIDLDVDDKTIILINNYQMAKYKTKERALEVLDEIHSCLQTNAGFDIYSKLGGFADDYNKKYNLVPVYQMPIE